LHPVWEKLAAWVAKDFDEKDEKEMRKEASTLHLFWFIVVLVVVAAAAIYQTCTQPGGIPY
jgi:hypothetical protein